MVQLKKMFGMECWNVGMFVSLSPTMLQHLSIECQESKTRQCFLEETDDLLSLVAYNDSNHLFVSVSLCRYRN